MNILHIFSERSRTISAQFASFCAAHWKVLSFFSAIIGIFLWTNWYFSPHKRLERLAEAMRQSAISEVSPHDIAKMMDFLQIRSGGSTEVTSSCVASNCEVIISHYYFTGLSKPAHEEKTWKIEAKVVLMPLLSNHDAIGIFPQSIKWAELAWGWNVSIIDRKDWRKNVFYSGDWSQLTQAQTMAGSNAIAPLLQAIAVGMQKELHR